MPTTSRVFAPLALLLLATAPVAQAHPGHEGHELTWDLRHLAAHPIATLLCFAVAGAIAWGFWLATRSDDSLRSEKVKRDDDVRRD